MLFKEIDTASAAFSVDCKAETKVHHNKMLLQVCIQTIIWKKRKSLNFVLPTGGKDAAKAGSTHRSSAVKAAPSAAKTNNTSSKDRPASQQGPDLKRSPRSASKPDAAAGKGDKVAADKGASRSQAVVEKQAGRKRRSRSGERSRSPKRKATSPAARNSGG